MRLKQTQLIYHLPFMFRERAPETKHRTKISNMLMVGTVFIGMRLEAGSSDVEIVLCCGSHYQITR